MGTVEEGVGADVVADAIGVVEDEGYFLEVCYAAVFCVGAVWVSKKWFGGRVGGVSRTGEAVVPTVVAVAIGGDAGGSVRLVR